MRRRVFSTLTAVAGAALVVSCSTTVPGTGVVDPSAAPRPDTGAFATTARTLDGVTAEQGKELEGLRMGATMPLLYEIDSSIHLQGNLSAGSVASGESSVKNIFGEAADGAFGRTAELGVTTGASDKPQGWSSAGGGKARGATAGLIRMASAQAASAAVGAGLMADDPDSPKKIATKIPGYDRAVAYTQDFGGRIGISTVAYLAQDRYVLAVYGDFSVEQLRTYFDKQIKGLEGFVPTALDKLTSLPADESGLARLTLAPAEKGTTGYAVPMRQEVAAQSDVSRSVKTFADAGVDVIASGGSTVYRAKDSAGAQHIADEFLAETKEAYSSAKSETVTGVPGATCLTFARYTGSDTAVTYCTVPVGRYLAEFGSTQATQSKQGIAAAYLILKDEK